MVTATLLLLGCVVASIFIFTIWQLVIFTEPWRDVLRRFKNSRRAQRRGTNGRRPSSLGE